MQLLAKNRRHTCTLHLHTPFAYAIITKTSYAFFAKITLCIFYPMTPFAHAFAYAIKKTPYAFFAKITLCMLFSVLFTSKSLKPLRRREHLSPNFPMKTFELSNSAYVIPCTCEKSCVFVGLFPLRGCSYEPG